MNHILLEVCVDSLESAIAAARGGADRLELGSNLIIGGTTPSVVLFQQIKKKIDLPIHVLIRPRFGDFCYTEYEFEVMKEEVKMFHRLGAEGVVFGILNRYGELNMEQMRKLIKEAGSMLVTLHRAFDVCKDPFITLEQACELGIHTILSSGQKSTCKEGRELLRELITQSNGRLDIMPGGGISSGVLEEIAPYIQAKAYHMSGKTVLDSQMLYQKKGISMGVANLNEYEIWRSDEKEIQKAKLILMHQ